MSSSFIERLSEDMTKDKSDPKHRETNRDKFEVALAHTGPSSIRTSHEREAVSEMPNNTSDPEIAMQDKADSPRKVEVSSGQNLPDKSSGGNLRDDKEDEDKYPSGIRLVFLTSGLMAVTLMVALDNYILGLLPITSFM